METEGRWGGRGPKAACSDGFTLAPVESGWPQVPAEDSHSAPDSPKSCVLYKHSLCLKVPKEPVMEVTGTLEPLHLQWPGLLSATPQESQGTGPYLGTGPRAVHDGVAAVQGEWVLQLGQALLREVISGVDHPAVGLGSQGQTSGGVTLAARAAFWWPQGPSCAEEWESPGPRCFDLALLNSCHLSRKAPSSLHFRGWFHEPFITRQPLIIRFGASSLLIISCCSTVPHPDCN